jgi:hypothetical protein
VRAPGLRRRCYRPGSAKATGYGCGPRDRVKIDNSVAAQGRDRETGDG